MGLFDNIFKKPKKEDVKKGETPQTSQLSTNTTSSISSANGYEELSRVVKESSERTAEVLAGRAAKEKTINIYSDYAETVIIEQLDSVFDDLKARAQDFEDIGTDTLGDINADIQYYNDSFQMLTKLSDQERFALRSGVSPNTRDDSKSGLIGRLAETEQHLKVLKIRYRAKHTPNMESILKKLTGDFKAIDDELKEKSGGRETSERKEIHTTSRDNTLGTGFSSLAKSAERRVDSDMGKTQEKPKEPMSFDDLLSGPML